MLPAFLIGLLYSGSANIVDAVRALDRAAKMGDAHAVRRLARPDAYMEIASGKRYPFISSALKRPTDFGFNGETQEMTIRSVQIKGNAASVDRTLFGIITSVQTGTQSGGMHWIEHWTLEAGRWRLAWIRSPDGGVYTSLWNPPTMAERRRKWLANARVVDRWVFAEGRWRLLSTRRAAGNLSP